ncbi:hypothetical protein VTN77DRAFT_2122 [Rasamsonia byssochlamydoides]|uniref:uncharacterized protein n=1 Tax=Rasamsonia byssochlamydoides TaxID=89139 RepID=UPI003742CDF3
MAGSHDLPSPSSTRRSRGISFSGKSDKSHRSSGSGRKISLVETPAEKAKRVLHTKADPTLAMNEAQPAAVALEKSNLVSLRSMQHKDQYGNIITDPDISNPTRPRYERPLETIRSFEAAIEGSYNSRRLSYAATEGGYSRPGSYYGGNSNHNRYNDQGNYSYGRGSYSRPDSYSDNYGGSNQQYYPYNQYGGRPRPRQNSRMNSEYGYGANANNFYPQQSYQRSNDNMTSGSGSGSNNTDQWGNSTDPSSVNSSMDRLQQQLQNGQKSEPQKPTETFGFSGFGPGPQLDAFQQSGPTPPPHGDQYTHTNGTNGVNGYSQAPPPPTKDTTADSRGTLKKNGSEKRQSWFKKRFSRN